MTKQEIASRVETFRKSLTNGIITAEDVAEATLGWVQAGFVTAPERAEILASMPLE